MFFFIGQPFHFIRRKQLKENAIFYVITLENRKKIVQSINYSLRLSLTLSPLFFVYFTFFFLCFYFIGFTFLSAS